MTWPHLFLCGALLVAAITDCRRRRIPNTITVPLALAGLLTNALTHSFAGLSSAFGGALLLFFLFALGRAVGVFRGGDVKLAAAVGAWLGVSLAARFLLLWAGCNVIAWLYASRRAYSSWATWWGDQRLALQGLRVGLLHRHGSVSYPGAVTIATAAVLALLL